ncbi:hypothetical protein EUGRSUZ_G02069 [Eucalyptus grandis]|uniref:Uncharacterized protein n=2 Tax=Eucalyptus grandis TaxID=71139 RepID=A0ACC3K4Z1_EUCGR|nr:hypothetical protein EUGRSUZ_G02069 [Eucalyptus grandis]
MGGMSGLFAVVCVLCLDLCLGHGGSCPHSGFSSPAPQVHSCGDHAHDHDHDGGHHHHSDHGHHHEEKGGKLPEELAEEEDLKLYGFGFQHGQDHDHHHDHHHHHHHVDGRSGESDLSGLGLWVHALGCSLLVSMASLICLIILPVMFVQGKPSKAIVDSLALFGAGAMLGDAFLHQLPHAFGGGHSHSDDHSVDPSHLPHSEHEHHHSLKDLSVGMSILGGIVLFLLVEKLVRYVEEKSRGTNVFNHGHHHHHHKSSKKLNDKKDSDDELHSQLSDGKSEAKKDEKVSDDSLDGDNMGQHKSLRKRKAIVSEADGKPDENAVDELSNAQILSKEKDLVQSPSNLVFGYLNLFSDGVHNFTDGMALGSAFLLYGSVGGWSRTLFLLAHELPQEVGDFGILVRSGFSVSKALFFNFLSALVALGGTTLALLLGQEPGQSSLIEGFTAGGFIYIAVAGVLAEMNNSGHVTLKSTLVQLTSLVMGMGVALFISLVE